MAAESDIFLVFITRNTGQWAVNVKELGKRTKRSYRRTATRDAHDTVHEHAPTVIKRILNECTHFWQVDEKVVELRVFDGDVQVSGSSRLVFWTNGHDVGDR